MICKSASALRRTVTKVFLAGCAINKTHSRPVYCFLIRKISQLSIPVLLAKKQNYYVLSHTLCSESMSSEDTVKHNPEEHLFYIAKKDDRAYLEYQQNGPKIILLHTEVPESLQGLGLGKILAKEALKFADENNFQLEIKCDFVRHFVSKYEPKYIKYITE